MMSDRIRFRLHRDDRGVAVALVLLIGVTLVILSSIMVARGFRQMVNTASDDSWDSALFAAEAGLDDGMVILDHDFDFTTGHTLPEGVLGTESERVWAIEAADALDESFVVQVPDGEYALVRPDNSDVIFAVGYAPERAAVQRRVRVVRASVEASPWTFELEYALLVGDDLELTGSGTINDLNDQDTASVHANGQVVDSGSYVVEGCLTASLTDYSATAECPSSPMPPEPMPVIEPLLMYPYATHVLCDDGAVYGGPAHTADPDPDLLPCNGNETGVLADGWESVSTGGVVSWTPKPWADFDGVFYIDNGNFDGKLGSDTTPVETTIILASGGGDSCSAPATGQMILAGNSSFSVHPDLSAAGFDIAVVAQGDFDFEGQAAVGGAILVHEQIDYRGTAGSWGAVVAVDACDTLGSPVSTSILSGGAVINYPGPLKTPFSASTLRVDVIGWYEL